MFPHMFLVFRLDAVFCHFWDKKQISAFSSDLSSRKRSMRNGRRSNRLSCSKILIRLVWPACFRSDDDSHNSSHDEQKSTTISPYFYLRIPTTAIGNTQKKKDIEIFLSLTIKIIWLVVTLSRRSIVAGDIRYFWFHPSWNHSFHHTSSLTLI